MKRLLFAWTLLAPSSLFAQAQAAAQPTSQVSVVYRLWVQVREYVTQSAADMSEAQYNFRPTPDVRTFGELIGHLAGSQMNYCALVLGEKSAADGDVERGWKTKAALQQAWQEANAICSRAYALSDSLLKGTVNFYGSQRTKMYVLMDNMAHDHEHYGNIVTYMRMNQLVPPSSRQR